LEDLILQKLPRNVLPERAAEVVWHDRGRLPDTLARPAV